MKRILHQIKSKIALNKHKLRKPLITVGVFIVLAGGFLFYTINASAVSWWTGGNGAWGARKQLTVTNNSSASLSSGTSIAISIDTSSLVGTGKLRSDCADLRILYQPSSLTTTELTRHIVFPGNSTCATSTATKVYFKIQSSLASAASSTDYYLYYKNLSATAPTGTDDAFDVSSANATLVCPFNGTTTCAAGETPSTSTGAIRYSGSKGAMSFDGNSDYVTLTDSGQIKAPFNNNTPLTVEFWVKVTKMGNYQDFFGQSSGGANFFIGTTNANTIWVYGDHCSNIDIRGGTIVNNQWTHIAYTQELGSAKLYQDGILVGSDTAFSACSTVSPTYKLGYAGNGYAGGYIDELRVSSTMRYTSNFTRPTNAFVRDSSTALLLHMDESGGDPRNTTKTLDDSGNGNHGTITGANYVAGLVGVDNGTDDTGNVHAQSYAGHEGVFIEEGTTNLITNPSFENATYDTNWTAGANLTASSTGSAPFVKFGTTSTKLVASASAISTTSNMFYTNINAGATSTHILSAYVYDGTSGNVGGTVSSSIAKIVYNGTAQTTTYTDMGGGWWRLSYYAAAGSGAQDYGVEAQVSKTIYVDGVQLEQKQDSLSNGWFTSFADGSLGIGYSWSGTANNSTSVRTAASLIYPQTNNWPTGSAKSVSLWYKHSTSAPRGGATQDLLIAGTSCGVTSNGAYAIRTGGTSGTGALIIRVKSDSGTIVTASGGSLTVGSWTHIVGIWDTATASVALYANNTLIASTTGAAMTASGGTICVVPELSTENGNGSVSDLRIYDNTLTSTQVTDLYQAGLVSHSQANQIDAFGDTDGEDPVSTYHMDEAQGSTVYDSTLLANNLTLGTGSSAPTWETTSVPSSANHGVNLKFDGSNDYVTRTYDVDFDPGTSSFSVSGFFRHPSTISGTDTILARYGAAGYKVYMDSSGYLCFGIDDDSTWGPDDSACSTSSQGSLADSKWHSFTAVKTSTTSIALYLDGILVGSDSTLAATATLNTANTTSMYFGIDSDFTSNPWTGNLDELYFYSYARSAAQIKADALGSHAGSVAGVQSKDPLFQGLVGYWKMDETSGNATDASGNGYTLTNNGTTTFVSGKYASGSEHVPASSQYFSTASTISGIKTVAFWVNPDSTTNYYTSLTSGAYITSSSGTISATGFTTPKIYVNGVETSTLIADVWQHVVVVTDTAIDANQFYIGRQDTNYFDGTLDETRLYNRVLSPTEVQQLYNFAPGPVAHWKFDDNTGLTAGDVSGNGNNGVLTSGPSWTTGKYGGGIKFDGVNDYINIGTSTSMRPNYVTVSAWIKTTSSSEFVISSNNVATSKFGYALFIDSSGKLRMTADGASGAVNLLTGNTSVNDGLWHYVTGSYDGTNVKVLVDGKSDATPNSYSGGALEYDTGASTIGLYYPAGNFPFLGVIDDVRVYDYIRTSGQIFEDMHASHPLGGPSIGAPVGYWKLDEGYGTSANDSSSNSNTLTLSSATSAWTNSGKFFKAWDGNGSRYMSRADDADFDFAATEDVAISLWFKSDSASNPGAIEYLVDKESSSAGYGVYLNTNGTLCFGIDDDTTWSPDVSSCTTNDFYDASWHHVAVVRDAAVSDKTYLYVDGILRDSDSDSTTATLANSDSLTVGDRNASDDGDEFAGDIDEVKIYRGILSASQVKADYNKGSSVTLGVLGNNSSYDKNAANQEYCVPGDSTSCAAPGLEWKFDENTGASAFDSSGNGFTGTFSGPSWSSGKVGGSVKLDGTDDYVGIASSAPMTSVTNWTLSAWIKPANLNQLGFAVYNGSDSGGYGFGVSSSGGGSNGGSLIGLFGGVAWVATGYTFTDTNWHHVEMARDTTTTRFYVDGIQTSSTGSDTPNAVAAKFTVGGEPVGGTLWRYFAGNVDHVRTFSYVRTPAQIAYDYNRGRPIAHYRLDECAGAVANDASGKGNSGTVTIGSSGSNTSAGNCTSGTSTEAWYNGVSGKFNSSLKFDGTDDYISIGDTSPVRFDSSSADFSLFAWIKRTTTGTEYIISKEDADNDGWRMQFNSSNQVLCSEDATDVTSTVTITDTNWHFVGCTIDRDGNGQVYIDGIANGSAVAMGTDAMATTTAISIGTRSYTATSYFAGQIDDVRIYNYALTASQVKNVMNGDFAVRYAPATGQP